MTTKKEAVIAALYTVLSTDLSSVEVLKNAAEPQEIPNSGLVIVRDGDPGEPEPTLGGDRTVFYQHVAEIEIYVEDGNQASRDSAFDTIAAAIGTSLEGDLTLGSVIKGMTYSHPEVSTEPIEGGDDIKWGTIYLTMDYEASSPLA